MFTKRIPLKDRFESKVLKTNKSECWLWIGVPNSTGYGTIGRGGRHGKTELAHRIAYELAFGKPPSDLLVCHRCDIPLCVNPDHLFLGTIADNNRDRDLKGRCGAKGELPGEDCQHAKLTTDQVLAIRDDSRSVRIIAKSYGVSRGAIYGIKNRLTWRHV